MAEHLNAILVRKGYEAFGKGDTATLAELLADEIKWHTPKGNNPLSGDYSGKQEVMGFFGKFAELGIRVNFDFHDILANDDHVVVLANARAQREGKTYEGRAVQRVARPGRQGRGVLGVHRQPAGLGRVQRVAPRR